MPAALGFDDEDEDVPGVALEIRLMLMLSGTADARVP
jgi:hypothetical protein